MEKAILNFTKGFEKFTITVLLIALVVCIAHALIGFVFMIGAHIGEAWESELHMVNKEMLHELYSSFLLLLIGLELMRTTKIYLQKKVVHAEVVLLVALIAMAREVIDMEFESLSPVTILGIGILIIALAGAYWIFNRTQVLKKKHDMGDLPD
jgi:uncharacterized membrane protein (DUF373 family)